MIKRKQAEFQNALKALSEVAEICKDGAGKKYNKDLDTVKSKSFAKESNKDGVLSPKDSDVLVQEFTNDVKLLEKDMMSTSSNFKIRIMEQNLRGSHALPTLQLHSQRESKVDMKS